MPIGETIMILQEGDKNILTNVAKTVLILTVFMFVIIMAANILS
jgi:hypothetical protein